MRRAENTVRKYAVIAGLFWTVLVLAALFIDARGLRTQTYEMVKHEARAYFNKDLSVRKWATMHGGVYVPATERTKPNPRLDHIAERDIVTPSGRKLTLMNPAYMLRQIMEEYETLYGVKGKITSLRPINPVNEPDAWERSALKAFEAGAAEMSEFTDIDGKPHLRLIRPMYVTEGCLKCHGYQGYSVGDIRGGVGVSVPMDEALLIEKKNIQSLLVNRLVILGIGLIGIIFGSIRIRAYIRHIERAEAELKDSEARIRLLMDSTAEAIYGTDIEGRCTFCNSAFLRLTGYESEAGLIGENIHKLIHHTDDEKQPVSIEDCPVHNMASQGREAHLTDELFWRSDGSSFYAECWAHPVRSQGKTIGSVITLIDVTERLELERQLAHSQKMESIGRLAGGISHDFNNMLSAIIGYAELLLLQTSEDDPKRDNIEIIRTSGKRAAELTRQLLSFSRKKELRAEVLDIGELISGILKMVSRLIGEDISVRTRLAEDLQCVKADRSRMEQIIMNLAVNARDAMPKGGVLSIEAENRQIEPSEAFHGLSAGRYVELSFSDTGHGMSEEVQQRIFEPFYTTKSGGKGTGLGLSTVYGIVTQHGGHVDVKSRQGEGTTFTVLLPAAVSDDTASGQPSDEEFPRGSETVLVVEDEREVRNITVSILESLGYRVLQAADAEEAIKVFTSTESKPNVVLTDIIMPGISGFELARVLKESDDELKVMYMTGYIEGFEFQTDRQRNGPVLEKPFTPAELARELRELLDGSAGESHSV